MTGKIETKDNVENEVQVSDLVVHALDQKPSEFNQSFAQLMQQRIEDAVHEKKLEIASVFAGPEDQPSQYEVEADENEEEEIESEVEEEPEQDV
jgi:hypothetical protein